MVRSILDETINYTEIKTIAKDDINFDAVIYDTIIDGKERTLAIGQAQYTFSKKNIIYFPIYLIIDESVADRVGVYELFEDELIEKDIYDDDGDIKIKALRKPLYFSYISELLKTKDRKALEKKEAEKAATEAAAEAAAEAAEATAKAAKTSAEAAKTSAESIKLSADKALLAAAISAESATKEVESVTSKVQYVEEANNLPEYLKKHNYTLSNVKPDGNCLFAVIRDALKTQEINPIIQKIHKSFSYAHTGIEKMDIENDVNSLRDFLSKRVTEGMYTNYKSLYAALFEERDKLIEISIIKIQELKDKEATIKIRHKEIAEKFKLTSNIEEQTQLKIEADELAINYRDIIREKKVEEVNLQELETGDKGLEYLEPLKDIDSFEKFKTYIKSNKFWGESWAISILEEILNIKLILLSEEKYDARQSISKSTNFDNIIYCGDIINEKFITQGYFNPELYILVYHDGMHYQLIKYKNQGIFTFTELPTEIKNTIKKKCFPNKEGPYYLIKELNDYQIQEPVEITGGKKSLRKTRKSRFNQLNSSLEHKKLLTRKS
jgi:hypothetical protein